MNAVASPRAARGLDWPTEPDPALPELEPAATGDLRPGARLDGVHLDALRGDVDATGAALLECLITDARPDAVRLGSARLRCSLIEGLAAPTVEAGGSTWVEVVAREMRAGVLDLHGAELARVSLRGRIDYLTARGATLTHVDLTDCRIGELDLGGAKLRQVRLRGARIGRLVLTGAELQQVDLRGAELEALEGVAHLAGAVVDDVLLGQLAPALAEQLGIRVLP